MIGHYCAGPVCIAVAQGLDQRFLVVVALFPELKIGWRIKASVDGQVREKLDHEVNDKPKQRILGLFCKDGMEP